MRRKSLTLVLIFIFFIGLSINLLLTTKKTTNISWIASERLADINGRMLEINNVSGKRYTILNFWATWCGPCRYEIPDLVKMRSEYETDQVAIIGVSLDQGDDDQVQPLLSKFIERYEINYPIVHDGRHDLVRQFVRGSSGSMGIPMTFVIDREGRIYKMHMGVPKDSKGKINPRGALSEDIDALLSRS